MKVTGSWSCRINLINPITWKTPGSRWECAFQNKTFIIFISVSLLQVRFHSFIVLILTKNNNSQQILLLKKTSTYCKGVASKQKKGLMPNSQQGLDYLSRTKRRNSVSEHELGKGMRNRSSCPQHPTVAPGKRGGVTGSRTHWGRFWQMGVSQPLRSTASQNT